MQAKNIKQLISKLKTWKNNFYEKAELEKAEKIEMIIPAEYQDEFINFVDNLYKKEIQIKRTANNWKKPLKNNQIYKTLRPCLGEKAEKWFTN